jgi:hypothetical protein
MKDHGEFVQAVHAGIEDRGYLRVLTGAGSHTRLLMAGAPFKPISLARL